MIIHHQSWPPEPGLPIYWARIVIMTQEGAGCVLADYNEKRPWERPAYLYGLQVDEASRGKGLGLSLLEAMEHQLKEKGVGSVALDWQDEGKGDWILKWYQRKGYKIVDRSKDKILRLLKSL